MEKNINLTYVNGSWYTSNMEKVNVVAKCEVCGKPIELKVFWKKYCGKKCRMNGWILKKAKLLQEKNEGV
jgi:predicted nucleic acid-binding Zn ribbon protein